MTGIVNPVQMRKRFPDQRRVLIISDVHAHRELLDRALAQADFGGEDFLILLGDLIECGPDNLGTLRRAMELQARGNCVALAGNWDYYVHLLMMSDDPQMHARLLHRQLVLCRESGSSMLGDFCRELGIPLTEKSDLSKILPRVRRVFSDELRFLGGLPLTLDAEEFFCVHGGVDDLSESAIARLSPYDILKNDFFAHQAHAFDRWVIAGHTPILNYGTDYPRFNPLADPARHILSIDGGCGKALGQQLNVLILQKEEAERPLAKVGSRNAFFMCVDEYPTVTALDEQEASQDPVFLRWNDPRQVTDLTVEEGMCRAVHADTGRILTFPAELLDETGSGIRRDYTDYRLEVHPGDRLKILQRTSRGLYCKKDGIAGWYFGRTCSL